MFIEEKYYTPKEVMALGSISRSTLYRLLNAGKLKAVKIGTASRIKASSVTEFFANAPEYTSSN